MYRLSVTNIDLVVYEKYNFYSLKHGTDNFQNFLQICEDIETLSGFANNR